MESNFSWIEANNQSELYNISLKHGIPISKDTAMEKALVKPYVIVKLILGTAGIALNILSIIALFEVRYKWTCVFKLMLSLMLSDILISISSITVMFLEPFDGIGPQRERLLPWCAFIIIKALFTMAMNITLLNLTAMAFDHFIAIFYPLKYPTVLGGKKCNLIIVLLWVIAFLSGYSDFLSPILKQESYRHFRKTSWNLCHFIWLSRYNEEYTTFGIAFVSAFVMIPIYLRIYFKAKDIKKELALVTRLYNNKKVIDKNTRNNRTLVTTLMILGTFVLCWLPLCLFQIIAITLIKYNPATWIQFVISCRSILHNIDEALLCILLVNPICDPIIYAIRIREVRQGFLKLLNKVAPKFMQQKFDEPKSVFNYRRYSVNSYLLTERRGTQLIGVSIPEETQVTGE